MATQTDTKPVTSTQDQTKQPHLWNVVLLDDQDHTYEYVIEMMQDLFAHSVERAFKIAKKVDSDGRAICLTTHKEHAELKREQIIGFGKDPHGSMSAIIEPAEFDADDSDKDDDDRDDKRGA